MKSPSRVRLLVTPWTAAYQAPPSMGLSRQEYWSGVPLPSPRYTLLLLLSHFSCVRLCDPIDGSPPGSPVPGILEWVAISFSSAWKWKVKVKPPGKTIKTHNWYIEREERSKKISLMSTFPHLVSPIKRNGKIQNIHWATQAGPFFFYLFLLLIWRWCLH